MPGVPGVPSVPGLELRRGRRACRAGSSASASTAAPEVSPEGGDEDGGGIVASVARLVVSSSMLERGEERGTKIFKFFVTGTGGTFGTYKHTVQTLGISHFFSIVLRYLI